MSPSPPASTLALGGDLMVSRIGFGAMQLTGGGAWGDPDDRPAAIALLRDAIERGANLVDTADAYGPETNERLIADALHPYHAGVAVATKGGQLRPGPGRWRVDGSPERLRAACEASLRRLRLETIDLYQLHAVDEAVPLAESVGALSRLREEGKVRHVGLCNVGADELTLARTIVPVVSVQNRFNLYDRAQPELLELCEREGIAFLCWFPLANGQLVRPTSALGRIAADRGATPAQVALAWLLARSPVTVPIPGTSSRAHLAENVGAVDLVLSLDDLTALDQARPTAMVLVRRAARRARRALLRL